MKTQCPAVVRLSQRSGRNVDQPIGDLMARAIENPGLISLAAGFVDRQSLPVTIAEHALSKVFASDSDARSALQYGATLGDRSLRELILDRLRDQDGLPYSDLNPDRIMLTAGSNQMLHLLADALLDPGDIVLCASPTYLVFMGILDGAGARSFGVATDQDGMVPASVDDALAMFEKRGELERVKAIYLVSYFDNPTGLSTALQRRSEIVEVAQRWSTRQQIHVIEDAAYRELRYAQDDVASARSFDEDGRTVIHTGSFSKSFSPGVRVGWGILPEALVEPLCNAKGNIDFGAPHLNQYLMATVIKNGDFDPHVDSLRSAYRVKLDAMLQSMDRHMSSLERTHWNQPSGGLYVWLTLPEGVDASPEGPLFQRAIDEGVLYVPGHYCYPSEGAPVQRNTIRLSFGVQTPDKIDQGIEALARAIQAIC